MILAEELREKSEDFIVLGGNLSSFAYKLRPGLSLQSQGEESAPEGRDSFRRG